MPHFLTDQTEEPAAKTFPIDPTRRRLQNDPAVSDRLEPIPVLQRIVPGEPIFMPAKDDREVRAVLAVLPELEKPDPLLGVVSADRWVEVFPDDLVAFELGEFGQLVPLSRYALVLLGGGHAEVENRRVHSVECF